MASVMLRFKTDVDIDEAAGRASFSIWYGNDAEAYTLRVEPLTDEQREDYAEHGFAYAIRDGYSEDMYYTTFDGAVMGAWAFYQETESQYLNEARGIE